MKKNLLILIYLFFFIYSFYIFGFTNYENNYISEKGIVDLSNYDLNNNPPITLDGEWEFYWNKLLTKKDLNKSKPSFMTSVPSTWNIYSLDEENLPGFGYATYRVHVKTNMDNPYLRLKLTHMSSAYNIFIDNELIASSGTVSKNKTNHIPENRPQSISFKANNPEFDIIVQVSNFTYYRGGMWYSMYLGSPSQIEKYTKDQAAKEMFFIGSIVVIIFIYINVYFFTRDNKSDLYFIILCILILIKILLSGEHFLFYFLPFIGFKQQVFLYYISVYWSMVLYLGFIYELFREECSRKIFRIYIFIASLYSIMALITPIHFYTKASNIYYDILVFSILIYILIVLIKATINKKRYALALIINNIFFVICLIHDILINAQILHGYSKELLPVSTVNFIYFISFFLASKLSISYKETQDLSNKLIASIETEMKTQSAFLQAQIKPHFIYNSINTMVAFCYEDPEKTADLLTEFSNYLRNSFDFNNINKYIPLKKELEYTESYLKIQKARFEERISYDFIMEDYLYEKLIPPLIIQPIVENAVIHGILKREEGGLITVSVNTENSYVIIKIKDNGVGMSSEILEKLFYENTSKSIGLKNIHKRLNSIYNSKMLIESTIQKGTIITIKIPE